MGVELIVDLTFNEKPWGYNRFVDLNSYKNKGK